MYGLIFVVLIIAVFLLVAGSLFLKSEKGMGSNDSNEYRYTKIDLFSDAEKSFFHVLQSALNNDRLVLAKVRIADVVKPEKGMDRSKWQTHFNKIAKKHFDYVICNPLTLEVDCVVELDDESHNTKSGVARDEFVDSVCSSASITIHHITAKKGYVVGDIRSLILGDEDAIQVDTTHNSSDETCPKCTMPLVVRITKKGENSGREFLGCSGFPKCRFRKDL